MTFQEKLESHYYTSPPAPSYRYAPDRPRWRPGLTKEAWIEELASYEDNIDRIKAEIEAGRPAEDAAFRAWRDQVVAREAEYRRDLIEHLGLQHLPEATTSLLIDLASQWALDCGNDGLGYGSGFQATTEHAEQLARLVLSVKEAG